MPRPNPHDTSITATCSRDQIKLIVLGETFDKAKRLVLCNICEKQIWVRTTQFHNAVMMARNVHSKNAPPPQEATEN